MIELSIVYVTKDSDLDFLLLTLMVMVMTLDGNVECLSWLNSAYGLYMSWIILILILFFRS